MSESWAEVGGPDEPVEPWSRHPLGGLLVDRLDYEPATESPELLEQIVAWHKMEAFAQAGRLRMVVRFTERQRREMVFGSDAEDLRRSTVAQLAMATGTSKATAARWYDDAQVLSTRLPGVLEALGEGRIDYPAARAIADETFALTREQLVEAEPAILEHAEGRTAAQIREHTKRVVARIDADALRRRAEKAVRERHVRLDPEPDGMATLSAYLPAAQAITVYGVVNDYARRAGDDPAQRRTMDARRADAFYDLITQPPHTSPSTTCTPTAGTPTGGAPAAGAATSGADPARAQTDTRANPSADPASTAPEGGGPAGVDSEGADPAGAEPERGDPADADPEGLDSVDVDPADVGTAGDDPAGDDPAGDDSAGTDSVGAAGQADTDATAAYADRRRQAHVRARTEIRVTVPLSTLLGRDELPGELAGYGPIPASVARELAADPNSTWRRLVTDPQTGALLDYGRTRYRPPPSLAGYLNTRADTCIRPGCRMPAEHCDLDHHEPHDPKRQCGPTSAANMDPHCRSDHILKQLAGWKIVRNPDGTVTWTLPTGHHITRHPPPLGETTKPAATQPEDPAKPPF